MAEEKSMVKTEKEGQVEVARNVWPFRQEGGADAHASFPVDICETADAFYLVAEMPGVKKDDANIRITENELTITGRFQVRLDGEEDVIFREIPGADYRRTFTLSDAVDREKISAELNDGVLKVRLDKSERLKPREIPITA